MPSPAVSPGPGPSTPPSSASSSTFRRAHSSAARPVRSSRSNGSASACRASSRLANKISSINWSSSLMLRKSSSRTAKEGLNNAEHCGVSAPKQSFSSRGNDTPAGAGEVTGWFMSSRPMRIRASGERSSCEALASSDLCEFIRVSMRSAAWLKRPARKATSSRPSMLTRADKSPSPQRSTPRCSASSRSVRRRITG